MTTNSQYIYNFNAGPAMLPKEVMEIAREEFLDYKNTGMSVMEMSHRSDEFQEILDTAVADLRELFHIPSDYSVAFCPGGATLQFSAVPLNLLEKDQKALYSLTGVWSVKAFQEARRFSSQVEIAYDGKADSYKTIPSLDGIESSDAKFLYITSNNTIYGTQYKNFPITELPLVADMTSDILSRPLDINRFGAIFAGAQKNIGPSGLTVLIVKNSLLTPRSHSVPLLLDWKLIVDNGSLYNTPPTYPIYMAGLVFAWLKKMGGIEVQEKINIKKSTYLYDFLDSSSLFFAPMPRESRSIMNVVFHIRDKNLEEVFQKKAEENGFVGLPGHRLAGGFRASLYNAMPEEGVYELVKFMKEFEKTNG